MPMTLTAADIAVLTGPEDKLPPEYLTPTGKPKKRWVQIGITDGTADRWLLHCHTLDALKKLTDVETDSEAVAIVLTAWYHDESLDKAKHRCYYWDDPNGL